MFKKLEKREAFRLTHSFILIGFDVFQALYEKRPASISRLVCASHRMMHYVIHADDQLRKKGGQWRMRRALAAAGASEVILRRLHSESEQRAMITAAQEILERTMQAYRDEISATAPEETMSLPPRLLDLTYIEHVQTAEWLARLCYPVALSIEVKQPASALKLMEAAYDARRLLHELTGSHRPKRPEGKLHKAVQAVKCVRAVLVRLRGEEPKEPARITAAVEVAERLLGMLQPSQ